MKKLNFLLFVFSAILYYPQTISGTILSKGENQPIAYAKIGIDKQDFGSIADKEGNFSIDLSKANPLNEIRVEVAGYDVFTEKISDFIKKDFQKIFLKEKVKNIQEVKLKTKKLVDRNWGVNTKTKKIMYSVNPALKKEDFLSETALQFKAAKKSKIKAINLNIASFTADRPVVMRYTIYNEKNGFPNENILDEEITVELTKNKIIDDTFTLDLNDQNIWVQGKFFVGIQFLNEFKGKMNISAALLRTGFLRRFYGDWQKMIIAAPAINIDVKVDKNAKDENVKEISDEQILFYHFPDVSKYLKESNEEIYGKNTERGTFLKLKDADLYYEVYGEGEPLFLLHGNSGSIKDFYQQIPVLSKQYKVIAMDTRAQGKSIDKTKKDLST